jgi:hypothetical protein
MCIHGSGPAGFLLWCFLRVISQKPDGRWSESRSRPSSRAIRGMRVVAVGILSQVMINSSDGNKAFAFFCTVRRQKGLTGPVISRRRVVTNPLLVVRMESLQLK